MPGLFRQTDDDRQQELLSSYIDGELTDDEVREVEELLGSSDDARQELAGLKMSVALIGQLPELALPRSFKLDVLPEQQKSPWWSSLWATGLVTSMATMLLVALVAGDMLNVLTQTRAAAIESVDSATTQQAASSAAFASAESAEAPLAPPLAAQAAAFEESVDSAAALDEPAAAPPVAANQISRTREAAADINPAAASPLAAVAGDLAVVSTSADEEPAKSETAADAPSTGPQLRTLSAPATEGTLVQEDDPDVPVPAPLAAPAGAPGIASIAAASSDAQAPEDATTDVTTKAIEEFPVSAGASVEALALPAPAADSTQSADDQVPLTTGGEGSDAGALAIASAPALDDDDGVGAASLTNPNVPMPATASIETQNIAPTPIDENISADEGIELPLRQLEIGAAIVVLLFATGSILVTRRRRSSVA